MGNGAGEAAMRECVHDSAREPRAYEHACAISDERNHSLGRGAQRRRGCAVNIYLADNKEEVVADSMQQNPRPQHPHQGITIAEGE